MRHSSHMNGECNINLVDETHNYAEERVSYCCTPKILDNYSSKKCIRTANSPQ